MIAALFHKNDAACLLLTRSELKSPEEPAQQATRKIVYNTSTQSPIRKGRCLAEFVAPRESNSVGNCQNQGNNCMYSISIIEFLDNILKVSTTRQGHLPIKLSQITPTNLTIAKMANPTQSAGVTYRLSQKNRLSVAEIVRTLGSEDSKTQCESPEVVLTSFHQRRPTRRRPAMFLR